MKIKKLKNYVIKILLSLGIAVTLSSVNSVYASSNSTVTPLNLEECAGQTTIDSNVKGKIIVSGKWILRNNGTWSYSETFKTSGTSSDYEYSGELYNRYSDFFNYRVYEWPKSDAGNVQIYSVWVYLTCSL